MSQPAAQVPTRSISLMGAFSIVAGSMLGIGIFLSPPQMAAYVATPGAFLAVWAVTGLIVLGGAVSYAELGTRMPRAGGDYVFLREAYGPSVAFAAGWGLFAAIFAGSIAAVAVAMFQYQVNALLPGVELNAPWFMVGDWAVTRAQGLGMALVLALTALNSRGVRPAAMAQEITTLLPVAVLFVLSMVALGLWAGGAVERPVVEPIEPPFSLSGFVAAYLAAYFAFSGWNAVIYVAGEVADPDRTIPRALIGGTLTVTALYLLLCVAFIAVLGMDGLAQAGEAGSRVAAVLAGEAGATAMNVLVLLCLLATLNSSILGGARVAYAMALDGALWRGASQLHATSGAPVMALWIQGLWASLLVLSNSFNTLLLGVGLSMVVIGSLTVSALFRLRRTDPDGGSYRAFAYPWLPGLYLASSAVVIFVQVRDGLTGPASWTKVAPLGGLVVVAGAWIGHALWRRSRPR